MLKPIIIANWKMDSDLKQRINLAHDLKNKLKEIKDKDIVICPSFVSLVKIGEIFKKTDIKLGAQDVFWEETGAYTGEVSPDILKELECQFVIVGHSERRQNLGETDEMVNKKVETCIDHGLRPIICVGETREERESGQTNNVIFCQLSRALKDIDLIDDEQMIIAYEPVWVIGTGQPVKPEDAEEVLKLIRQTLIDSYPLTMVNNNIRLVYGGSIDADQVENFAKINLLNGFLVGGASLDAEEFVKIAKKFKSLNS